MTSTLQIGNFMSSQKPKQGHTQSAVEQPLN